jgi:hypothetical protein
MPATFLAYIRRHHLALIALFVALGGTSYAAATGSIGSRAIKNNSVRSRDIRNNQVRSRDVRNFSLLKKDFKAGQLPAGPTGPQGPRGLTGAAGPLLSQLPSGRTLRGHFATRDLGVPNFSGAQQGISFAFPLSAAPTGHYIPLGGAHPAQCTGTAANPTAARGHLCLYEDDAFPTGGANNATGFVQDETRFGALVGSNCACGQTLTSGTWAVTAP